MAQNRMWNGQTEGWTTRQLYAKANTKGGITGIRTVVTSLLMIITKMNCTQVDLLTPKQYMYFYYEQKRLFVVNTLSFAAIPNCVWLLTFRSLQYCVYIIMLQVALILSLDQYNRFQNLFNKVWFHFCNM